MSDADRLAALLHNDYDCIHYDEEDHDQWQCVHKAKRLAAAGVTVAAQPASVPPEYFCAADCGCAGGQYAATCRFRPGCSRCQPAPDALPVNMDDYMAGYRQAKADAAALAATMPPNALRDDVSYWFNDGFEKGKEAALTESDALRAAARAFVDIWGENEAMLSSHTFLALRAALGDER